ncbi:MAG: M81 family metallopeptidase [Candidatus Methylomirabilales bacterium]
MPSILIAECKQEISSFNPVRSHYADFAVARGDGVLTRHRGVRSEVSGALAILAARPDLTILPAYSARAITSAGTLAAPDFARIRTEFLEALRRAPRPDAAYFALHGAMAAADEDDVEGRLLEDAREILGEAVPLVASLDLHGVLTDRMLRHADAVVMYHTYPHVDFFETGQRAARLLLRLLAGQARPVTAAVTIPALVRGDELITETGLLGGIIREAQALERSPGGLVAGVFIGNPFTDVAGLCTRSLVVTDGDAERARREALRLAEMFWAVRERLQAHLTPLPQAIQEAREAAGTVILVDAADATSSGAPGDSNAILRGLVEQGYPGRALIPLVDPPAVRAAFAAGVGATIQARLGGALDPRWTPLPVRARVRLLSDGRFRSESHGDEWNSGDTAVLDVGRLTLVCTSRAVSLYDRSLFLAHGQDPQRFDLVVQKSPHCQDRFYKAWATRLINVDVPGATSANLKSLGHTRCLRPMFPLDEGVEFRPEAKLFQR